MENKVYNDLVNKNTELQNLVDNWRHRETTISMQEISDIVDNMTPYKEMYLAIREHGEDMQVNFPHLHRYKTFINIFKTAATVAHQMKNKALTAEQFKTVSEFSLNLGNNSSEVLTYEYMPEALSQVQFKNRIGETFFSVNPSSSHKRFIGTDYFPQRNSGFAHFHLDTNEIHDSQEFASIKTYNLNLNYHISYTPCHDVNIRLHEIMQIFKNNTIGSPRQYDLKFSNLRNCVITKRHVNNEKNEAEFKQFSDVLSHNQAENRHLNLYNYAVQFDKDVLTTDKTASLDFTFASGGSVLGGRLTITGKSYAGTLSGN